ncbi:tripartite tricarboxylate transporter TctB family protein [Salipiger mangrovisoli]|uniref:Tripartite tricarboxylate transporter TctB family protein n=1 Tax=Salipiger mangrovisoli TaxID=2865933 RepID=A0ABR9X4C0_9RHOB|nr:tripartite tricarboxylate transporter TctB family protein [Salipiger mangrovisoli]MBE9638357.1 tripartite tricarboxylate transporter TctB family protein [Salipiger mangrovisoli]
MQRTDRITSLALIGLGLIVVWLTSRITYTSFTDDPGPRLFPYFGAAVLILSGLGIFLRAGRSEIAEETIPVDRAQIRRGGIFFVLLALYALAMKLFGFYAVTPLLVFAVYWLIAGPKRRAVWRGAVLGLGCTLAVYLLFTLGLGSYLPEASMF